jgi:hypothetical protein
MRPRISSAHKNRVTRRFASGLAIAALAALMFVACSDHVTAPQTIKAHHGPLAQVRTCYSEVYEGAVATITLLITGDYESFEVTEWYYDEDANVTYFTICVNWTDPDPPGGSGNGDGGYNCFSMPWLAGCEPPPPLPPACYPSCGGGDPGGNNNPPPTVDSISVSVSADSTNVAFGSTITATATVSANNGGGYNPDGWSWSGRPGTTCTTALTCGMRVTASGWMRFGAHKNAVSATDSVQITVAQPRLRLRCNGDTSQVTLTRAANLACTAETASGGTVTSVAWEFTGPGAVGTLNANVLGSANPLSGPVVSSGTLTVNGTIDSVAATAASISITVNARALSSFQWASPSTNASVPSTCQSYFSQFWGWTAVAGTCDFDHVIAPLVTTTNGGVVTDQVPSGPNNSLHYVTNWSAGVGVGYDYIAELKGGGANYTLLRTDPNLGQCITIPNVPSISTPLAPINDCTIGRTATPVSLIGAALNAHESCHQVYDIQTFNNLNGTSGSDVQKVPALMESIVKRSSAEVLSDTRSMLLDADRAIINVGHSALDHPSGSAIPMWGPFDQNYTNWSALSWDYVRTC